jgi:hypothetical protein
MRVPPSLRTRPTPAAQASALLLRIGLALLLIVAPMTSVGSRRAFLVLAPLGISIVFLAALLEGRGSRTVRSALRFLVSPAGIAAIFLLLWAALSLSWTSAQQLGFDRLVKIAATLLLAVFACVSLPPRMRASNLYLIPIGVALAGGLIVAAAVYGLLPFRAFDPDQPTLDRAAAAISLQLFAAVGWLMTKQRPYTTAALVALVVLGTVLCDAEDSVLAIVCGALVAVAVAFRPRLVPRLLAAMVALLLLLAPLLVLVLHARRASLFFLDMDSLRALDIWARVTVQDPLRMLTGRGMESAAFDRLAGGIGLDAPRSMLFEMWYELGLLGVLALASFVGMGVLAAGRLALPVAASALGAITCAFILGCLGSGTVQTWWMTTLCLAAVAFAGVQNGQYRSERPRATLFGGGPRPSLSDRPAARELPTGG